MSALRLRRPQEHTSWTPGWASADAIDAIGRAKLRTAAVRAALLRPDGITDEEAEGAALALEDVGDELAVAEEALALVREHDGSTERPTRGYVDTLQHVLALVDTIAKVAGRIPAKERQKARALVASLRGSLGTIEAAIVAGEGADS